MRNWVQIRFSNGEKRKILKNKIEKVSKKLSSE